jgi:hypothetical protein
MNEHTIADGGITEPLTEAPLDKLSTPMALLYAFELETLNMDQAKITKPYRGRADQWWVSAAGATDGPVPFRTALKSLMNGAGEIAVLHDSAAQEEPAPWRAITYRPYWQRPSVATTWTIGFWASCAFAGWAVLCILAPRAVEAPLEILYWISALGFALTRLFPTQAAALGSKVRQLMKKKELLPSAADAPAIPAPLVGAAMPLQFAAQRAEE